ncbi:oligosaccharide flippase family protein, partial [Microbacterium testaceum]
MSLSQLGASKSVPDGLSGRAARGGVLTIGGQAGRVLIQFLGLVVLSRILPPESFGVYAVVAAVFALGELLRDFGLTNAAIRSEHLSRRTASNVFWLSLVIGTALALLVALAALALFVSGGASDLSLALALLGFCFFINAAQSIYQILLVRGLRFGALALTDVTSQIIGLAVAILTALSGFGLWSLMAQLFAISATLLGARILAVQWIPSWPSRDPSIKPMLGFGANVAGAQVLGYVANNADTFSLSVLQGPVTLGFYSRAFQLLTVPMNQILSPLTNVFLPILSQAAGDRQRFSGAIQRTLFTVGLPSLTLLIIMSTQANAIVSIALGEQWRPSSGVLAILAIGGCFQVFGFAGFWVFLSAGLGSELLRYNLLTKPLTAVLVATGASLGAEGAASGYALGLFLSWPLCYLWLAKRGHAPVVPAFRSSAVLTLSGILAFLVGFVLASATAQLPLIISLLIGAAGVFVSLVGSLMAWPLGRIGLADSIRT